MLFVITHPFSAAACGKLPVSGLPPAVITGSGSPRTNPVRPRRRVAAFIVVVSRGQEREVFIKML